MDIFINGRIQEITAETNGGEEKRAQAVKGLARAQFTFSEGRVQGAQTGKRTDGGDFLYVISPGRFKLHSGGADILYIKDGAGFIKWKKGEKPFSAGTVFLVSNAGEYEINGACEFIINKSGG